MTDKKQAASFSSFVDVLRMRAESEGDQVAYTFLDHEGEKASTLSYAQLDKAARSIASEIGDCAGQPVLLLYPPGPEFIQAFFGCLYAGAMAVPARPPNPNRLHRGDPRLAAIVKDARASTILTTSAVALSEKREDIESPLQGVSTRVIDFENLDPSFWLPPPLQADNDALIQYTSGSTATPRGVLITHRNLIESQEMMASWLGTTRADRFVSWLPPYHDMGLIGAILHPLFLGARCWLMSPMDFIRRPSLWLNAVSRYQGTVSGAPDFAYALATRRVSSLDMEYMDLHRWRVAFNGSEPIREATLEAFADKFAARGFSKKALTPCYGLAEATLFVSGAEVDQEPLYMAADLEELSLGLVRPPREGHPYRLLPSVGKPGADTVIVHSDRGYPLGEGQVGEIWLAGPCISRGYHHRPGESRVTFQACLPEREPGYLRTGDMGFIKDGHLFITGREKELIIIRGRNHYPQDIEWSAETSLSGHVIGRGAAFSVERDGSEKLVVVWEVSPRKETDPDVLIDNICQSIVREHMIHPHEVVLIENGTLPVTTSGKVRRRLCRKQYLKDELHIVGRVIVGEAQPRGGHRGDLARTLAAVPTDAHRRHLLTDYLAQSLGRVLDLNATQLATSSTVPLPLDSLSAIELAQVFETDLGVMLPVSELLRKPVIGNITQMILEKWEQPRLIEDPLPSQAPLGRHPLSYSQRLLWSYSSARGRRGTHNISHAAVLSPHADLHLLRQALTGWWERHAMLRTTLGIHEGEPFQQVHRNIALVLEEVDAASWDEAELREHLSDEAHHPLGEGPLLRLILFHRREGHVLLLVADRVAFDLWSLALLVHELGVSYHALKHGRADQLNLPSLDYTDFVHWQEEMLSGPEGERLWRFWYKTLFPLPEPLSLPTDRPRTGATERGQAYSFRLPPTLVWDLSRFASETGSTLFMVLMAAWQFLLQRYTGQDEMIVGTVSSGRDRSCFANLVGPLANPIPIRGDISGNPRFRDFLERIREAVLEALAHQAFPYSLMVERLTSSRDGANLGLFRTMFLFQGKPPYGDSGISGFALGGETGSLNLFGLELKAVEFEQRTTRHDLTLTVIETRDAGELGASLEYNADLFDRATIGRMANHFITLLEALSEEPELRSDEWHLLGPLEREALLQEPSRPRRIRRRGLPLHQMFQKRAARHPQNTAVVYEHASWTFGELNQRANQMAHYLLQLGVRLEDPVALCCDRSLEMVAGVLGILKSGAAIVPVSRDASVEQLKRLLDECGCRIVVGQEHLAHLFRDMEVVFIPLTWERAPLAGALDKDPRLIVPASALANLRYREGADGSSRWVPICHINLTQLPAAIAAHLEMQLSHGSQPVWCALTELSEHGSVAELLLPLALGSRVIVGDLYLSERCIDPNKCPNRHLPMGFSLALAPPTDLAELEQERLARLGQYCERHGFQSIWLPPAREDIGAGSMVWAALASVHTESVRVRGEIGYENLSRDLSHWRVIRHLIPERIDLCLRGDATESAIEDGLPKLRQEGFDPWLEVSREQDFQLAGKQGAHLLIRATGRPWDDLETHITAYRQAWSASGHEGKGQVTMVLPTLVSDRFEELVESVIPVYRKYLSTLGMDRSEAKTLAREAVRNPSATVALFGSPRQCATLVDRLKAIGVNEIAMLINFGMDPDLVRTNLPQLIGLKRRTQDAIPAGDFHLLAQLERHGVTHLHCPTEHIGPILDRSTSSGDIGVLDHVVLSGSQPGEDVISRVDQASGVALHYLRGFVETATAALWHRLENDEDAHLLGKPLAHTRTYILAPDFYPLSTGRVGELVLGGDGVSRGYHNQPRLTAERFVPDPFGDEVGARLFRTGQSARFREDGLLEQGCGEDIVEDEDEN